MATDITMGIAPKIPTQRHWDWQHCLTAMSILDKNFKMTIVINLKMELSGFEPLTPSMPLRCATNCAITPHNQLPMLPYFIVVCQLLSP